MTRKMDLSLDLALGDMTDAVNGTVLATPGLAPSVRRTLKEHARGAFLLARCGLTDQAAETLTGLLDHIPDLVEDGETWHLGMVRKITTARNRLAKETPT